MTEIEETSMRTKTRGRTRAAMSLAAVLLPALLLTTIGTSCMSEADIMSPPSDRPGGDSVAARPLIGITATVTKKSAASPLAYARAVHEAGGVPVILPTIDDDRLRAELVRRLDGLVLIGGRDVPPSAYGEEPHETVEAMPDERWAFEPKLIEAWLETGKPILGVCLGLQMTNVVRGGSLIQDIPTQVGTSIVHRNPPEAKESAVHRVAIAADSRLHEIFKTDSIMVASSHHQAVKRLGRGLRETAHADDGVIEALELPEHRWAVFVQWHPEQMERAHRETLFGSLVGSCEPRQARTGKPSMPPKG